VSNKNELAWNN